MSSRHRQPDRWKPLPLRGPAGSLPHAIEAMQVEAPSLGTLEPAVAVARADYLHEDEIIQFSLRPSPWYVALISLRDVLVLAAIGAVAGGLLHVGGFSVGLPLLAVLIVVATARVALASLQWASRLYVLTNRRVLRFSGVLQVKVVACRLERVGQTQLKFASYQTLLRIGSIHMLPGGDDQDSVCWQHISRPNETYELLVRAIRKAQYSR